MAQWFKKLVKTKTYSKDHLISFNRQHMQVCVGNLGDKLSEFKNETSCKIIKEVLVMARDIQILDMHNVKTESDLTFHRGRLQALNDMCGYIETTMTEKKKESKKRDIPDRPRGTIKLSEPVF